MLPNNLQRITVACILAVFFLSSEACSKDPMTYLEKGKQYLEEGKYSEATIEFRNAIFHKNDLICNSLCRRTQSSQRLFK